MNRLRTILLSVLILALVAGGLPMTESLAKWGRPAVTRRKKNKRHSRAWWRRYRARARARRERAMQRRQRQTAAATQPNSAATNTSLLSFSAPVPASEASRPAALQPRRTGARVPFEFTAPYNWGSPRRTAAGDLVFSVRSADGRPAGMAVLAPVSLKGSDLSAATSPAKLKTVGGAPVAALRRTVIDRMVAEGGWVTNDMVQDIRGRRVFVVVAQTGAPGAPTKSWTFYFTELDSRVYSLATTAPVEFAAPVAAASEQFMASLRAASDSNAAQK
jgi:hypothetical protein